MKRKVVKLVLSLMTLVLLSITFSCVAESGNVPFYASEAHTLVINDITGQLLDSTSGGWTIIESVTDPAGIEYYMSTQEKVCLYDDNAIAVLACVGTKNLVFCRKQGNTAIPTVFLMDAIEENFSVYDDSRGRKYTEKFGTGMIYGDSSGFWYYDFDGFKKVRFSMTASPVAQYGEDTANFICYANGNLLTILNFTESLLQEISMPESITKIFYVHPVSGEIIVQSNSGNIYVVDMKNNVYYDTSIPHSVLYIDTDCYVSESDYALKVTTVDGESSLIKKADDYNLKGDMSKLRSAQYGDMLAYIGDNSSGHTVIFDIPSNEPTIIGNVYSFRINNYMKFQPGLYSTSFTGAHLIWIMTGAEQAYVYESDAKSEIEASGREPLLSSQKEAYMQHGVIWTPVNDTYGFLGGGYSNHYWVYDGNNAEYVTIAFEVVADDNSDISISGSNVSSEQDSSNTESSSQYVKANGGETNVRTGPGLGYEAVGIMLLGSSAKYLNNTSIDDRGVVWYNIEFNGINSWVSSRYTSLQENFEQASSNAADSTGSGTYIKGTSGDSNVRTGPGLGYSSVGTLQKGATATYLNEISTDDRGVDWYKISYSGGEFWVSSRYTTLY